MKRSDGLVPVLFFLLAVGYLLPVTLGSKTLVPADNLFAYPPWSAYAEPLGVGAPHNALLSDLLLENLPWKRLIVEALRQGELPLWNPYLFTGIPFLAAGQHSALYPFSLLFYVMPPEAAYGWFVAIQLGIAGAAMYWFGRSLGLARIPALIAGTVYAFSAFFLVSVVFPMVLGAACWLPLLLLCVERIVSARTRPARRGAVAAWIAAGALTLAVSFLSGHVEIAYYNLLVMAFYGAWRLIALAPRGNGWARSAGRVVAGGMPLAALVALGTALAAVQIVPLYELVSRSARQDSQSYETIVGYAFPVRQIATFFVPDFFGNPSHHSYVDWWSREPIALEADFNQRPANTIFWGVKNYVEAGSYVGILPLLLAVLAVAAWLQRRHRSRETPDQPSDRSHEALTHVPPFAALGVLSLAFVFGTPLYALLFYGLPGFSQLHSPFRWVYPYTLSLAVLAGIGAEILLSHRTLSRWWAWFPLSLGGTLVLILTISWFVPAPFVGLAERALRASDLAQGAFADARAFFSYEAWNLLRLSGALLATGLVILLARRGYRLAGALAALVVAADLLVAGANFYTAAEPDLLRFDPPAVAFLRQDKSLFRIASLDKPGEKLLNPNAGMYSGLQDIRGYDSIIPKQYHDWMNLIETQGELIYNRIAPFYWRGSLDSALLDLANVKYVLTTQDLGASQKFTKVYSGEIDIYRNEQVMPRAFLIPNSASALHSPDDLKSLDPRTAIALPKGSGIASLSREPCPAQPLPLIRKYTLNEVVIEAAPACPVWLVLADAYFPGWTATVVQENLPEREAPIALADGNFRAVELVAGKQTVRFRYSPLSLRLGAAISFFAGVALLLVGGFALWARRRRELVVDDQRAASRVLKNSAAPMLAQFLNKAIDTVFTLYMLRVLGVEDAGKLATATLLIGYCDIVANFGMSTLVTRDVSRDRSLANRYLANTGAMRLLLIAALAPLLAVYLWAAGQSPDIALAIWLLFLGLIPSSVSASLSAIFYAAEQMEYPAIVTVITTLMKVAIGTLVLMAGYGFVGLAAANIFTNVATLVILLTLFARHLFVPRPEFSPRFAADLVQSSYPLMLNDMLSRMFNRVDVLILQQAKGNIPVGWYSTTYKYLEGINILPSTFTLALFPLLSRYAAGAPDALMRAYQKSLKYLTILALPLTLLSFAYADLIMFVFGGEKFLPESAIALRLIIGFLPFSFINNVTHYVLIAVNQQKFLTRTFVVGAAFNIGANLWLIPQFSYRASALITIGSELLLLSLFYLGVRRHVGAVDWFGVFWRPVAASVAMAAVLAGWDAAFGLGGWVSLGAAPVSLLVYAGALLALGTLNADDREMLRLILPARWRGKGTTVERV